MTPQQYWLWMNTFDLTACVLFALVGIHWLFILTPRRKPRACDGTCGLCGGQLAGERFFHKRCADSEAAHEAEMDRRQAVMDCPNCDLNPVTGYGLCPQHATDF